MGKKKCLYCGKELTGQKKKYCNTLHRYRYWSIQNDKPGKFSKVQHMRMVKAGRSTRTGRSGARYM